MFKKALNYMIVIFPIGAFAQSASTSASCALRGAGSLQAGAIATYNLKGCKATNWTLSAGVVNAKTDSSVTIFLNSISGNTVVITASNGGSAIAVKTVAVKAALPLLGGTIIRANQTTAWRRTPALITASAAKQGLCNGVYSYQWFRSIDSVHFDSIPGAVGSEYQPGPLDSTTFFKRRTNCNGSVLFTSNSSRVSVLPRIAASGITPNVQMLDPDSVPVKMTVTGVYGGNSMYTYQWQVAKADGNRIWQPIAGATSADYVPGTVDTSMCYRVLIKSNSDSAYSPEAVIDIYPPLSGGVVLPATQTVPPGGVPAYLSLSGYKGSETGYSYQWYSSPDGINWTLLDGVATEGYGPGGSGVTTYYRVAVSANGKTVYSASAQVIVSSSNSNQ